jgi:hypothetical protein
MPRRQIWYPVILIALVVFASARASADDRVAVGYLASSSIVSTGNGLTHSAAAQWQRSIGEWLELGAGAELGVSGGHETSLTRFAPLAGIAVVHHLGALTLRIDEQIGWQLVHGNLTLDGIPIAGTETRSFHEELTVGLDAPLSDRLSLRGRGGFVIDGLYPAGHSSTRVSPCVGVSIVFSL